MSQITEKKYSSQTWKIPSEIHSQVVASYPNSKIFTYQGLGDYVLRLWVESGMPPLAEFIEGEEFRRNQHQISKDAELGRKIRAFFNALQATEELQGMRGGVMSMLGLTEEDL